MNGGWSSGMSGDPFLFPVETGMKTAKGRSWRGRGIPQGEDDFEELEELVNEEGEHRESQR